MKKPLLLLGAYGRGNAGDDVFLHCALELFKERDLYINSADDSLLPEVARGKVQTISTVSMSDAVKKIRLFLQIKEVVYWGGDLWVELYGTRMPRQLLYKMLVMNVLFKLFGKRIYYVGCGIGKLHGFSLLLARTSAKMATRVVVREARTAEVLGADRVSILPDLAINLPYVSTKKHEAPKGKEKFVVTISLLQSIPQPEQTFPKLIAAVKELVASMPEDAVTIQLLPMHISEAEAYDDLWATKQLIKELPKRQMEIITERELPAIVERLKNSHLIIGGRLHANILGVLSGTPSIGISYRPKVGSFFRDNDLSEYFVELDQLDELTAKAQAIRKNYDEVANLFYDRSQKLLDKRKDYVQLAGEIQQ